MHLPKGFGDPIKLLSRLKTKPENYWIKNGEKRVLKLFKMMAERVPAYKDFLKKNKVDGNKIKSIKDFSKLPPVNKDNYLRHYPLASLCWDGKLKEKSWTISATSGSTGEPFYFPRQRDQDWQYAVSAELYLLNNFQIDKKSTLYIIGWGMGIWIGGVFSYQAVKYLAERGNYPISLMTPGTSGEEIIKAVLNLGHKFDQIIIGGYPPLIKDMVDSGIKQGLNWKSYPIKFIFSAEGFCESFRDYLIKKTGLKNPYLDTLNHYGTVDLGTMAHETPSSILIRKLALKNPQLNNRLFGQDFRQPTLTQYIPELFFFEEATGGLLCSAFSGLPLVRYDLKDTGGIVSLKKTREIFSRFNINLDKKIKEKKLTNTVWNLPFVYVFERKDFTVKLSGANIFPQEIKKALQQTKIHRSVTGKFTMIIKLDKNFDQYLEINIELRPRSKIRQSTKVKILEIIINQLLKENSEYRYLYDHLPRSRLTPKLIFWPTGAVPYFSSKGKQKWVER